MKDLLLRFAQLHCLSCVKATDAATAAANGREEHEEGDGNEDGWDRDGCFSICYSIFIKLCSFSINLLDIHNKITSSASNYMTF